MGKIKLIYFKGCPLYEDAQNILLQWGCNFEEINQNDLSDNHPYKYYTSPAILKNEKLVFGEKTDSFQGGCSIQFPTDTELKRRLEL